MENKKIAKIGLVCLGESSEFIDSMIALSRDKSFNFLTESVYTLGLLSKFVKEFYYGNTVNLDDINMKIRFFDYCFNQFRSKIENGGTPFHDVSDGYELYMKFYNDVDFIPTLLEMWKLTSLFEKVEHVLYKSYVNLNIIVRKRRPRQYCSDLELRERGLDTLYKRLPSDEFLSINTYHMMNERSEINPYFEIVYMNHFKCITFLFSQFNTSLDDNKNIAIVCAKLNNSEFVTSYFNLYSGVVPLYSQHTTVFMIEIFLSFLMNMLNFSIRYSNDELFNLIFDRSIEFFTFSKLKCSYINNLCKNILIRDSIPFFNKMLTVLGEKIENFFKEFDTLILCYVYNSKNMINIWYQINGMRSFSLGKRRKILSNVCKCGKIESLQSIISDNIIYLGIHNEFTKDFISSIYVKAVKYGDLKFNKMLQSIIPFEFDYNIGTFVNLLYNMDYDLCDSILSKHYIQAYIRDSDSYISRDTKTDNVMLLRNIYNIVGIVKENVLFRNIENSILSESRDCFKFCIDLYLHVKSRQNIQFDISLLINRCMYVKDPFYLKYLYSSFTNEIDNFFRMEENNNNDITSFIRQFIISGVNIDVLFALFNILEETGCNIDFDVLLCNIITNQNLCSNISLIDLICGKIIIENLTIDKRNNIDDAIISQIVIPFNCFKYLIEKGIANIQGRINDYMNTIIVRNNANILELLFLSGINPRMNNNMFFIRALTNINVKLSTLEVFFRYDNTLREYSDLAQIRENELNRYNPPHSDPLYYPNVLDIDTYTSCLEVIDFLRRHARGTNILDPNQIEIVIIPDDNNFIDEEDDIIVFDIDDIEWEE